MKKHPILIIAAVLCLCFIVFVAKYKTSDRRVVFHLLSNTITVYDEKTDVTLVGNLLPGRGKERRGNVLLLHGSSVYGRKLPMYRMLAKELTSHGYTVALFDFRAYGNSEDPKKLTFEYFDFKRDVSLVVNALQWNEYYIIGHSMGASIAMNSVAGHALDGVKSIVSIGPARRVYERCLREDAPDFEYSRKRFPRDTQLGTEIGVELGRQLAENINIDNALGYFSSDNHCPLFLIDGELEDEKDKIYLRNYFEKITESKKYYTIPRADHYCNLKSLCVTFLKTNKSDIDIIYMRDKRRFYDMFNQIITWLEQN